MGVITQVISGRGPTLWYIYLFGWFLWFSCRQMYRSSHGFDTGYVCTESLFLTGRSTHKHQLLWIRFCQHRFSKVIYTDPVYIGLDHRNWKFTVFYTKKSREPPRFTFKHARPLTLSQQRSSNEAGEVSKKSIGWMWNDKNAMMHMP